MAGSLEREPGHRTRRLWIEKAWSQSSACLGPGTQRVGEDKDGVTRLDEGGHQGSGNVLAAQTPGFQKSRGRVFPLTRLGGGVRSGGVGAGGPRGGARAELEREPGPLGPALRRAGLLTRRSLSRCP
jgi:hypothetical protein